MIQTLIDPEIKRSTQGVEDGQMAEKRSLLAKIRMWNWKGDVKRFFSKETVVTMQRDGRVLLSLLSFLGLVLIFLADSLVKMVFSLIGLVGIFSGKAKFWETKLGGLTEGVINTMEVRDGVKRSFLIGLAFRNMRVKKMRSIITVGGMSLGIGAIVFLVSLGYGVQRLVVGRVARLNDLRMADVLLGKSSLLKLDDNALITLSQIENVESVLPMISTVGKVDFKGSVSEVVAYAVTGEYLSASNIVMSTGQGFETKQRSFVPQNAQVAGVSTDLVFVLAQMNKKIRQVRFNILEGEWMTVREEPNVDSKIIGYAKRFEGGYEGDEVWGSTYKSFGPEGKMARDENNNYLGVWIKAPFMLYEWKDDDYVPVLDNGLLDWREGFVAELTDVVVVEGAPKFRVDDPQVLGDSTESGVIAVASVSATLVESSTSMASMSARVVGTDASGVEWVEFDNPEDFAIENQLLLFPSTAQKVAVVNKAFLDATGIDPSKAVGEVFKLSLLISKSIKSDLDKPTRSEETEFRIAGVNEEGNSPTIYIPFDDLLGIGVNTYSQAKIVVNQKENLSLVREKVDGYGYQTSSVADTVEQIEQMFATVRLVLASFGLVALAVAGLGMFNTMTVSLMERTHEVGVMKAMGMRSDEVRELFLAEAMVMGTLGGIFGVLVGVLSGQALGVLLSVFSIANGIGWVSVSYVPSVFVIFILLLSFVVGMLTGIYPAKRATKISALDALRYE